MACTLAGVTGLLDTGLLAGELLAVTAEVNTSSMSAAVTVTAPATAGVSGGAAPDVGQAEESPTGDSRGW